MKHIQNILFVLFLLFVTSSFAQSQMLYGAGTGLAGPGGGNAPSSLYMINPNTGEGILIGPIGFNGVTGLEILPDGRMVASANADIGGGGGGDITITAEEKYQQIAVLIEINRTTGAGSLIGVLGSTANPGECGRMPDISYDSNTGTLFGYSDACGGFDELMEVEARFINYEGLYIINPNNADVTFVGPSGFQDGGNGMAVRPSDGTIFHTPNDADGLVILNRMTGAGTVIPASIGNVPQKIGALDFNSQTGVLFGVFKEDRKMEEMRDADIELNNDESLTYLVTINQQNGVTDMVGSTVAGLDAIVFADDVNQVPTLSEYGLIITGLLLLAGSVLVLRRRQKLSI